MCYNVSQVVKKQIDSLRSLDASLNIIAKIIEGIKTKEHFPPNFIANGFERPKLIIIEKKLQVDIAKWGLIPNWVKTKEKANQISLKTLNARSETIHSKPSFKDSFRNRKCIIPVNGFFENKHVHGKTIPHFIHNTNNQPIWLAGISSEWREENSNIIHKTFSIVTKTGNGIMADIHNNPKLREPRMPVALNIKDIENWMEDKDVNHLIENAGCKNWDAYPVRKLHGKGALGNFPEAILKHEQKKHDVNYKLDF